MSASTTARHARRVRRVRRVAAFGAGLVLGLSLLSGAAYGAPTEDTDANDGGTPNNVVDGGDNRHPSGKDRSVEHGRSGNQGKAASDPDDDGRGPERTNRGADKADGPGGDDLADQDGNNGCGNDDDFEDDNEGRCSQARSSSPRSSAPASPGSPKSPKSPRGPKSPKSPGSPSTPGSPGGSSSPSSPSSPGSTVVGGAVLSTTDTAVGGDATLAPAASVSVGHPAEVLGVSLVAPAAPSKPVASASVASRRPGRATEVLGVTYTRGDAGVSLARTGAASTLVAMGFGGVALLALGLGLTRATRWTRPRAAH